MRAVFLQSPAAAALATAVCVSVPAVAPHAAEAAPQIERRIEQSSVALAASASTLSEALTDTLTKLKLVLSPNEAGSALELLALPESIASQVQSGGIDSVPSTFIEAGRTASANLMSNLNASTSALASPLDIFAPYNALINFLLGPSTSTFTSVYGLIQGVGNFLGLPISIGGLLLGGGSAQVPGIITKFTQAAQTAIQNFPASIAATIQAIFGGFGGLGAASTLNLAAPTTLAATPSVTAAASPLDIFAPYNALINFLLGPSTSSFTSLYGLVQGVGNYLGLPISIGGLLLGGGSAQVPALITKFTQAAQTALANFPASIAATIQAIFGGFGTLGTASTLNVAAPTTLAATPSVTAAASPLDIFGPYNAIINFLVGPSTKTFTSIYGLVAGVGNYLGLPLSIGGLLLGGGSAQVPALITKFTQAAQTALANFPASIAATIQAVFGGFGAVSTLKATGTPTFKAASLDAAPSTGETKTTEKGDPAGTAEGATGGTTTGKTEGTTGGTTTGKTEGTTGGTTSGTTGKTEGTTSGTTGTTEGTTSGTTGTTEGTTGGTTSGTTGGTTTGTGTTGTETGKKSDDTAKKDDTGKKDGSTTHKTK